MSFSSGTLSFRRFLPLGNKPTVSDALAAIVEHGIKPHEMGIPEEVEYGFAGPRHIFDGEINHENNVFADAIHFGLRIDTNKIPSAVKKAHTVIEEEAVAKNNPSGFISKSQRKDVKETVRNMMDEELRSGKHRRISNTPILWDHAREVVYTSMSGSKMEKLLEIFERAFNLRLVPVTAGALGQIYAETNHLEEAFRELRPTRFVLGPDGEQSYPEYPWVAKGSEPKDFLGNEFLLWLWWHADALTSIISTKQGDITIFIDRSLDMDCAYGQTGKESLRGDGPSRSPEAKVGLRAGKMPRRAGFILDHKGAQFTLNLAAETMSISGAKLPEVEDAETPRVLFEERISLLNDMNKTVDAVFTEFLDVRMTARWQKDSQAIRTWIGKDKG